MYFVTVTFKNGAKPFTLRAHTLPKLTELLKEKLAATTGWASVTYENFVDDKDMSYIRKMG
jgi:hypothetical protein